MVNDNETTFNSEDWFSNLNEVLTLLDREDLLPEIRRMDVEPAFSKVAEITAQFQRAFVNRQQHKGIEANGTIKRITEAIGRLEQMRDELTEIRKRGFRAGSSGQHSHNETDT